MLSQWLRLLDGVEAHEGNLTHWLIATQAHGDDDDPDPRGDLGLRRGADAPGADLPALPAVPAWVRCAV